MKKRVLIVFCSVQPHEIPPYNFLNFAQKIATQNPAIFIDLPTKDSKRGFDLKMFLHLSARMFFYLFKAKGLLFWQTNFRSFFTNGLLLKIYLLFFKIIYRYKIILYTTSPSFDAIYDFIPADARIGDFYDNPDEIIQKNAQTIKNYDRVCANSSEIRDVLKKINKNCFLISTGYCNYSYSLEKLKTKISNTVVFYGGISHRINYGWLQNAASKLPEVDFFFIGQKYLGNYYTDSQDASCEKEWQKILKYTNVHYLDGSIDFQMVRGLLSSFSLGIIPYDANDSFNFNSHPIKLYDYLASDLPVLSTELPLMLNYKSKFPIYFAKNSTEFVKYIKDLSKKPLLFSSATRKRIKELLEFQSLENKFLQINQLIDDLDL